MFLAKIRGNVVTTQKVPKMTGKKLLIVEPIQVDDKAKGFKPTGRTLIAVDFLGAGEQDLVLVTQGSSARLTENTGDAPVDCVVIGILDSATVAGQTFYSKSKA